MENIGNKIKLIALATLLVGLSSWIYAECGEIKEQTMTPAVAINSLEDTILFRFLQDYAFLEAAAKSLDDNSLLVIAQSQAGRDGARYHIQRITAKKTYWLTQSELEMVDYWSKKVRETPFADLNKKLYVKLIELAEADLRISNDLMQNSNDWIASIKTKLNLADAFMLFEGLTLMDIDLSCPCNERLAQKMQSIKHNHYNNVLSATTNVELIKAIFTDAFENYRNFIDQNRDLLKKIELIANNNFHIKSGNSECIEYRTKKYCTITSHVITSLREMMTYAQQLLAKEKAKN